MESAEIIKTIKEYFTKLEALKSLHKDQEVLQTAFRENKELDDFVGFNPTILPQKPKEILKEIGNAGYTEEIQKKFQEANENEKEMVRLYFRFYREATALDLTNNDNDDILDFLDDLIQKFNK